MHWIQVLEIEFNVFVGDFKSGAKHLIDVEAYFLFISSRIKRSLGSGGIIFNSLKIN